MNSPNQNFEVPSSPQTSEKSVKSHKKRWYKKWWGIAIIIFLFALLSMITALAFSFVNTVNQLTKGEITPEILFGDKGVPGQIQKQKRTRSSSLATSDDPSQGNIGAPIEIVEFSDFQCPFCKQSAPVIKELIKDYGDKIYFVYRDFPVEDVHPQAVMAAMAGECAAEQGKFWGMHDKIFEGQSNLTSANMKTWAVQLGLNSVQFSNCLDSQKYLKEVENDFQEGVAAGVRATPTFFINGIKVEGSLPFTTFEKIILAELGK